MRRTRLPVAGSQISARSSALVASFHTGLPPEASSRIAANWDEDLVTPRQWDAGGHAVNVMAPGGWIAKTDADGKSWEVVSVGYRNPFDPDTGQQVCCWMQVEDRWCR